MEMRCDCALVRCGTWKYWELIEITKGVSVCIASRERATDKSTEGCLTLDVAKLTSPFGLLRSECRLFEAGEYRKVG